MFRKSFREHTPTVRAHTHGDGENMRKSRRLPELTIEPGTLDLWGGNICCNYININSSDEITRVGNEYGKMIRRNQMIGEPVNIAMTNNVTNNINTLRQSETFRCLDKTDPEQVLRKTQGKIRFSCQILTVSNLTWTSQQQTVVCIIAGNTLVKRAVICLYFSTCLEFHVTHIE